MNRPAALLALLALSGPLATQAAAPTLSGCPMFPAKNVWNTPVDTLAVHASSTTWVNTIGAANNLHPDFGTFYLGDPIGIPFVTVPGTQPPVAVTFDVPEESDPGPYPIPPDAPIEGGPASDGDRHVLVVNRDDCVLYETYYSFPNPDGSWDAFSGAVWDLKANLNRPDTWTSADAAGLPILPGLIRYGEFTAGEINHAIRFTAPQTRNQYVWPATHQASDLTGSHYPPMGARLRLKAAFDISGFDPRIQVILRALKKYGMILADNGSRWYLSGEHDPAWDDDLLGQLKTIAGSNFEAVETAPMRIATSSTKAFQPPPAVNLREVASGLTGPLDIANANDGSGRLFIVEKGGSIKILKNGSVLATPFFTRAVNTSGERGLLGLAFDPAFRTNRRFFVFYTPPDGSLQVSRYLARDDNPDLADMTTESTVINIPHPGQDNHNGGKLAFGPDGYLYIGDGRRRRRRRRAEQRAGPRTCCCGKLLRLDVSGASGYAIPPTNPFVGVGGTRGEIWAYGLAQSLALQLRPRDAATSGSATWGRAPRRRWISSPPARRAGATTAGASRGRRLLQPAHGMRACESHAAGRHLRSRPRQRDHRRARLSRPQEPRAARLLSLCGLGLEPDVGGDARGRRLRQLRGRAHRRHALGPHGVRRGRGGRAVRDELRQRARVRDRRPGPGACGAPRGPRRQRQRRPRVDARGRARGGVAHERPRASFVGRDPRARQRMVAREARGLRWRRAH